MPARRAYGSGRIVVRTDGRGVDTYHGVWRSDGRQVKRKLGLSGLAVGEWDSPRRRPSVSCAD